MKSLVILFTLISLNFVGNAQLTSLHEDFSTCIGSFPTNWSTYNVTGTDSWQCSSSGYIGRGTQMSGYSSGSNHVNEDWLISPLLNLSSYSNPLLSFWCRTKYAGPIMQVLISTNYSGAGDPTIASWSSLGAILPTVNSDVWFLSDNINLQAYISQPCYIAFKYSSTSSAAATWKVDEVNINDGSLTITRMFINTGQAASGQWTTPKPFQFTITSAFSSLTLAVPSPFELSSDGINFFSQLNYTSSIAGNAQTVYVRLHPSQSKKVYRSAVTFTLNGNLQAEQVRLLGTSIADAEALRVVNWNMRWFGDPSLCACDTNTSRLNATELLEDLQADIYCLEEVVTPSKIDQIASNLGSNYQSVVSPFCSLATTPSSSNYSSGQKLAFIYNTDKLENLGTFGLLASTYPSDTSANSGYYCFSSGRFPFVMKARLKLAGNLSDTVYFVNLHAKALSDITSYNRRQCGCQKMTDSLNALFPGKKIIVLGDLNDYLEGTDVSSMTVTPYAYLLNHGFTGITLPSLFPGQTSYVGGTNTIFDNVGCSSSVLPDYIDSSCFIFSEAENIIPDYAATTSDHFPVMSYFQFDFPNAVSAVKPLDESGFTLQNPSSSRLRLMLPSHQTASTLHVSDLTGHCIFTSVLPAGISYFDHVIAGLQRGLYFVSITNSNQQVTQKWLVHEP